MTKSKDFDWNDFTLFELEALIQSASTALYAKRNECRALEREQRMTKRQKYQEKKAREDAKSRELFATIEVGDMVRIRGQRDNWYQFRRVTIIKKRSFRGMQYRFHDPVYQPADQANWYMGEHHTEHLDTKVIEVIKGVIVDEN